MDINGFRGSSGDVKEYVPQTSWGEPREMTMPRLNFFTVLLYIWFRLCLLALRFSLFWFYG